MLEALEAAHKKLGHYYGQTYDIRGDLYATSTMLAPLNKFKFFLTKDWDISWRTRYRRSFQEFLALYQKALSTNIPSPPLSSLRAGSRLDMLLDGDGGDEDQPYSPHVELTDYLDSSKYYWLLVYLITDFISQIPSPPHRSLSGKTTRPSSQRFRPLLAIYLQSLLVVLGLSVCLIQHAIFVTIAEGG